jgi:hypothetical protein
MSKLSNAWDNLTKHWPWLAGILCVMVLNVGLALTHNDKEVKPKQLVCVIDNGDWTHIYPVDGKVVKLEEYK